MLQSAQSRLLAACIAIQNPSDRYHCADGGKFRSSGRQKFPGKLILPMSSLKFPEGMGAGRAGRERRERTEEKNEERCLCPSQGKFSGCVAQIQAAMPTAGRPTAVTGAGAHWQRIRDRHSIARAPNRDSRMSFWCGKYVYQIAAKH